MDNIALLQRVQQILAQSAETLSLQAVAQLIREQDPTLHDAAVFELLEALEQQKHGLGVCESLLRIPGITDIVVNPDGSIWYDRGHGLQQSALRIDHQQDVRRMAAQLAASVQRRFDDTCPYVDGNITRPDGTLIRFHAILAPPAVMGTCLSFRVLGTANQDLQTLVSSGMLSPEIAQLLRNIVQAKLSILIIGGTGSGKTTLLSALLHEVSPQERIICIEDTQELHPDHPHMLQLIARPANTEGAGAITLSDLLKQSLRMRPDRIIVGEIRGAEIMDLLGALNTGHQGGGGTIHANTLQELPARIQALGVLAHVDDTAIMRQFAAAIHVVVALQTHQQQRRIAQIGVVDARSGEILLAWDHGTVLPPMQDLVHRVSPAAACVVEGQLSC